MSAVLRGKGDIRHSLRSTGPVFALHFPKTTLIDPDLHARVILGIRAVIAVTRELVRHLAPGRLGSLSRRIKGLSFQHGVQRSKRWWKLTFNSA